uniref:3-ketodihydrosphingosine reductase n=1 Tax=Globisporangium ultimum (strain ATCC 200006 / CBS 805.95 / DAOM BR144) TaxID=431595 RepID=K3WHS3_GLOUD
MEWHDGWLVLIIFAGLCLLSMAWTLLMAPGFHARDKHVLISGATKGIGLAIAVKYAQAGARLSLVAHSMERLEHAKQEILARCEGQNDSSTIFLCVCDITVAQQVESAIENANAFHGRVTDHVVHAAVAATAGCAYSQDLARMYKETDVTYFGAVHLFKSAVPAMIKAQVRGNLVIVNNVRALTSPAGSSAFSGSLFALRGLAESLRNECIQYGIAVSMYYPGSVPLNTASIHSSYAAIPPTMTAMKEPATPVPGADELSVDFTRMHDDVSTTTYDAAAKSFVDGLRFGYFMHTNSWSGFCLRVLGAGVTPRKNTAFEFVLLFFMIPYFEALRFLYDRRARTAQAKSQETVTSLL